MRREESYLIQHGRARFLLNGWRRRQWAFHGRWFWVGGVKSLEVYACQVFNDHPDLELLSAPRCSKPTLQKFVCSLRMICISDQLNARSYRWLSSQNWFGQSNLSTCKTTSSPGPSSPWCQRHPLFWCPTCQTTSQRPPSHHPLVLISLFWSSFRRECPALPHPKRGVLLVTLPPLPATNAPC